MLPLVLSLALAGDPAALDLAAWEPAGERSSDAGTVTLRQATVAEVRCIEGTVLTSARPTALLAVTDRMADAPDWSDAPLAHSAELARDDDGFVLYQHANSPGWSLAADRFWVVRGEPVVLSDAQTRYRWTREDAANWPFAIETSAALARRPIELPESYGEWLFTADGDETVVRYRACADLGGSLPEGMVAWVTRQQVPSLMAELVQAAQEVSPPSAR